MKGILFTPEMARAVCDGRKTVTRRVIKDTGFYAIDERVHGTTTATRERERMVDGLCEYVPGERRCLLTTWAFGASFDRLKPTELDETFRWWHVGQGSKPEWCGKSRPGRFLPNHLRHLMPVLEVVSVRVERVQQITGEDITREGIPSQPRKSWLGGDHPEYFAFARLWDSINAARGFAWKDNPWVWRIEFRRVTP